MISDGHARELINETLALRKAVRYFAIAYDNPARILHELGLTNQQISLVLEPLGSSPIPRHEATPFS